MNKRTCGMVFFVISVLLFISHRLCAAIYLSNSATFSEEFFKEGLQYTGGQWDMLALISLLLGIAYLAWNYLDEKKDK